MNRAGLIVLAIAGCWSSPPAPQVPVVGPRETAKRSCAREPLAIPQHLKVQKWLGLVGTRSWAIVRRGPQAAVVGLGSSQLLDVPLAGVSDRYSGYAVVGTELWIAERVDGDRHELSRVDLAAARPVEQRGVGSFDNDRGAVAIGIGLSRVLVATVYPKLQMQLHDRATGKPIGERIVLASSMLDTPAVRCTGDDCFVVGTESIDHVARAFVERFDVTGRHEHEALTDDASPYRLAVAPRGDRTVVTWIAARRAGGPHDEVHARVLDRRGKPTTRVTVVDGAGEAANLELLAGTHTVYVAVQRADRVWNIGALDETASRLDNVQRPGFDGALSITGAIAADGILLAGFSTSVDFDHGSHSWWARAEAAFLPSRADAEAPIEVLPHTGGDGRGAMAAFPLVAPGRAAVLVSPVGPESSEGGQLVVLREPCRN